MVINNLSLVKSNLQEKNQSKNKDYNDHQILPQIRKIFPNHLFQFPFEAAHLTFYKRFRAIAHK